MQQDSIDTLLKMPPNGAEGAESSGYESAEGANVSSAEIRKLELTTQRLTQKVVANMKYACFNCCLAHTLSLYFCE